jgi:hypothetical protein
MVPMSWVLAAVFVGPGIEAPAQSSALPNEAAARFADVREARDAVAGVLRESNRAGGRDPMDAVPAVIQVYRRLAGTDQLAPAERRRLQRRLRTRLLELHDVLHRRAQRETRASSSHSGGGTGPAQELMDLIQTTIAPESWAANGGKGTMMFYQPQNLLVVRQTAEAHEQLGSALRQLRR